MRSQDNAFLCNAQCFSGRSGSFGAGQKLIWFNGRNGLWRFEQWHSRRYTPSYTSLFTSQRRYASDYEGQAATNPRESCQCSCSDFGTGDWPEIDLRLIWWSWRKSGDWMTSAWQQYKSEEDFRNSMSCAYMWPGIYKFNTKSGGLWIAKSMKLWKLNGPEQLRFLSCLIFLLICSEGVCESPQCRAAWGSLAQPLWKQNDVPQRSVSLDE
jgi:hypothetical protein